MYAHCVLLCTSSSSSSAPPPLLRLPHKGLWAIGNKSNTKGNQNIFRFALAGSLLFFPWDLVFLASAALSQPNKRYSYFGPTKNKYLVDIRNNQHPKGHLSCGMLFFSLWRVFSQHVAVSCPGSRRDCQGPGKRGRGGWIDTVGGQTDT